MKGRPTQKTTHPNKNSLHKQFAQTISGQFVQIVPPFPFKISRKLTKEFAQTVCANSFYLGGWFFGWVAFPSQNGILMAHRMKNLCGFSVFHCVEGAFGASSGGTPKMKNGAPRDELQNGRGRGWAVPYYREL